MELTLQQRLLRYLAREQEGEKHAHREMRMQPIDMRVHEGDCIHEVVYVGREGNSHTFACKENCSKFRTGDRVAVGDGHDLDAAVPMIYGGYEPTAGVLRLEADSYMRTARVEFTEGRSYCVDRRPFGGKDAMIDAVRSAFEFPMLASALEGRLQLTADEGRRERARASRQP